MKIKILFISFGFILLSSCELFKKQQQEDVIAQVNSHILYQSDLKKVLPKNISTEDSIAFVKNYIDQWAMDKILLDKAKFNLPVKEQERFQAMVEQYKSELYKKAYMDALIQKQTDSVIDSVAIQKYYESNKDVFRINEHLLKLRYIFIKNNLKNYSKIKESFKRFNQDDKNYLNQEQLKFDKVKLNDSVWIKSIDIFRNLDDLSTQQHQNLLHKNRYIEIVDSENTYFIYVKDVLKPNSIAPKSYIKPTIEQILKNKQKLELKKNLKQQILNDAIKNNDYEIFK
ncbi:peptidyl-prolyl cis-trans isomerase [Psychroflexus sp. MBR-150]